MKSGRTPIWNPFREHSAGSWTELVGVAERGRLTIPSAARKCIAWLMPLPRGGLLATIESCGRVELLPWDDAGRAVVETRIRQLNGAKEPLRSQLAVALADKHFRLTIEEPGRMGLPTSLQSFLEASTQQVRLVAMHQQLWLWNERSWQSQREDRERLLS